MISSVWFLRIGIALSLSEAIVKFTEAAQLWNKEVFGVNGRNKKILMASLRGMQRCLDQRRTQSMIKLELELLQELEIVLDQEEELWKLKYLIDWVKFGDKNTSYFHSKAITKCCRRMIHSLKLANGTWCDDANTLQEAATNFFEHLSADNGPLIITIPSRVASHTLTKVSFTCLKSHLT
ncbi:hypothetical protein V6N13_047739 [Hibiscus sabdariffa]